LQLVPPQQVCPSAPHGAGMPPPGAAAQVPPVQVKPALHAVPAQHGWPSAPQAMGPPPGAVRQVPAVHESPGLHAVPQHICPSAPHRAGAGLHTLVMPQVKPGLHELPAQQGWRLSPQATGIPHTPAVHARVPVHAAPGQHGCPSRPQARQVPI
jgi:hypothetical protein